MRSNVFILHKLTARSSATPPPVRAYRVDASPLANQGREDFPTIREALAKLAAGKLICSGTEVIEFREVA